MTIVVSGIAFPTPIVVVGRPFNHGAEARAQIAEQAADSIMEREVFSVGEIASKMDGFRAAAREMAREISKATNTGMTDDLTEIWVRKYALSPFQSPIPDELYGEVCGEAQRMLSGIIQDELGVLMGDPALVGAYGVEGPDGEDYFQRGCGADFIEALDEKEACAVAKTGVANAVEAKLYGIISNPSTLTDILGERPPHMSRQRHRALEVAFVEAIYGGLGVAKEIKAPYEKVVMANLPMSHDGP